MAQSQYSPAVQQRIVEVENSSEKLITYLQAGFVAMMAILYAISPKGFDIGEALFQPVPIALAIWGIALVFRLLICNAGLMQGFFSYLYILIDIVLLSTVIWSFHIQYEALLSISLKAPTYIFLVFMIVIRALRFHIRYIICSAVVVLGCWTALVAMAVQESYVTNSYLEYVSADSVLVGAEIERMLGIAVISVVLVIAVSKTKQLLIYSQQQQLAVQSMSQFFSPEIAQRIAGDEEKGLAPGSGEERNAVVMNIDLRGFTTFSAKNSVTTVMRTLSDYQSRVVPIIKKHGGSIDKFMGDGILVHFGVVDEHEDYGARAMRTIEGIIEEFRNWNRIREGQNEALLNFGVGLEAGNVLFGTVGNVDRLEFTVIGDPVNKSSKYEKATKQFGAHALCSVSCYKLALRQGYKPRVPVFLLKNRHIDGIATTMNVVAIRDPRQDKVPVIPRDDTVDDIVA